MEVFCFALDMTIRSSSLDSLHDLRCGPDQSNAVREDLLRELRQPVIAERSRAVTGSLPAETR